MRAQYSRNQLARILAIVNFSPIKWCVSNMIRLEKIHWMKSSAARFILKFDAISHTLFFFKFFFFFICNVRLSRSMVIYSLHVSNQFDISNYTKLFLHVIIFNLTIHKYIWCDYIGLFRTKTLKWIFHNNLTNFRSDGLMVD